MYTKEEKIELVKYLESVTVGSTESVGLEYMTEPRLDALIRLCKVNPANGESMMRIKKAMDTRNEYRATMREYKLREIQTNRYVAANANYDNLSVEYRQMFIEFVKENKDIFTQCFIDNFDWLDNPDLRPSVDFWTGELGVAVNEIVSRLLFGKDNIFDAITAKYTYDGVTNGPICSVMLVDELDEATKKILFWKYAKARLQYI